MSRKKNQPNNYINNKDFYAAIVEYRDFVALNPDAKIPNYIGLCVMQICNRLSIKREFNGYTYKDEMIDDAIENCIRAVNGFDPEKSSNPFAYFTQIAWNAFLRRIAKEKKEVYVKHKNMQRMILSGSMFDFGVEHTTEIKNNELSNDVIESYESKLTKTKKRAKMGIEKFIEEV
jgi:DNA-directed RNA polymerase specialized sigma24 family protein